MKYSELREKITNLDRVEPIEKISRSSVINEGFPGKFNLSMTEDPCFKKYGKFSNFGTDWNFSVTQQVIRHKDLLNTAKNKQEDFWKYLGVFDMADITGVIISKDRQNYCEMQEYHIKNILSFLQSIGIKKEKIYPSYQSGGNIKEVTDGKYSFSFKIPEDKVSKKIFIEQGIPENNLIPDSTRNTFLALHLGRKTPWGYRNEIHVDIGEKEKRLLDVATIEYSVWEPIYKGEEFVKNIVNVKEADWGFSLSVAGIERLLLVVNKLEKIQDCDHLKEFYSYLSKTQKKEADFIHFFSLGESLRTVHRIVADMKLFNQRLSKKRNKLRRYILQLVFNEKDNFLLNPNTFENLLEINASNQPWYPELEEGIINTIEDLNKYFDSRKK